MNTPTKAGSISPEAQKRLNAYTKQKKTYSYAMKSEWKRGKKSRKEFWTPKEEVKELVWKVFVWGIGLPVFITIIILGFYWAILDLSKI